ncbi:GIY-YIG nuclease family protein [Geojedonia litorea]|uniref:GIY-YIG nuclease family protein n=1 Tax=Geojedonia litorea TaxID=1268269 RepID=A0ABV9N170_9FLAO
MASRKHHKYWVYIITNKPKGVLYIGVTSNLDQRMEMHIEGKGSYFTSKYKLKLLVYYEEFQYIKEAIYREKQLKNWHRDWKINLIETVNPNWVYLWDPINSNHIQKDPETSSG